MTESKFEISAVLDKYPERTNNGREQGLEILHIDDLQKVAAERNIEIGVIAVPGPNAQDAADTIVEAGLKAILNFAPTRIDVPSGIFVHNVDFTIYLENLAYYVNEAYHRERGYDSRGGLD